MRKVIPQYTLKINGWNNIYVGKTIVSYCKTCQQQTVHVCTGIKIDGNETLYKFDCLVCKTKLEGKKY